MEGLENTTHILDHNCALLPVNPTAYLSVQLKLASLRSPVNFDICFLIGLDGKLWYVNIRLLAPDFSNSGFIFSTEVLNKKVQ
jgi:hypothetical protein